MNDAADSNPFRMLGDDPIDDPKVRVVAESIAVASRCLRDDQGRRMLFRLPRNAAKELAEAAIHAVEKGEVWHPADFDFVALQRLRKSGEGPY